MISLRLCIAIIPLALYALLIGAINLNRRPLLMSAARDTTALGMALAGMILVGPIELFAPESSFDKFGAWTWLLLGMLYSLLVTLLVMLQRPGLVIYNISLDEFRPALARAIEAVEPDPRWAGNTLALPSLGVELHVESYAPMRNVRLSSVGDHQSLGGWRQLEHALAVALPQVEVRPSPKGLAFAAVGVLLFIAALWGVADNTETVVQQFQNLMQRR